MLIHELLIFQITVFGESAGAASTGLVVASPTVKGTVQYTYRKHSTHYNTNRIIASHAFEIHCFWTKLLIYP